MLIKLTSKCLMMCPHCMEDAQETGLMMTLDKLCERTSQTVRAVMGL